MVEESRWLTLPDVLRTIKALRSPTQNHRLREFLAIGAAVTRPRPLLPAIGSVKKEKEEIRKLARDFVGKGVTPRSASTTTGREVPAEIEKKAWSSVSERHVPRNTAAGPQRLDECSSRKSRARMHGISLSDHGEQLGIVSREARGTKEQKGSYLGG